MNPQTPSDNPTLKPTSAYTTLFWFLVVGQILATFTALMAVATLLATAQPVVRWNIPLTTPTTTLGITDADLVCDSPADCDVVYPDCSSCYGEGTAVNRTAAARIAQTRRQTCQQWRGAMCLREPAVLYCISGRCSLSLEQTTNPPPVINAARGIDPAAYGPLCGNIVGTCNNLVAINCQTEVDGPFYYVNADSGEIVGRCGGECDRPGGCPTPCPPKEWTCN